MASLRALKHKRDLPEKKGPRVVTLRNTPAEFYIGVRPSLAGQAVKRLPYLCESNCNLQQVPS